MAMRLPLLVLAVAGLATGGRAVDGVVAGRGPATTTATTATTAAATTATSSAVPTHTIAVGATGFTFTPNNLTVAVGSVLEFNFYPGNHSVVRSAFQFPCIPYEDTGANRVGFFSGFQNTNVYSTDGPKFRVRVNDSEPIFYYCSAPGSCIDHGMLGVVNPNATWTLAIQEAYAANTTIQLSPGDPLPSETVPTATATVSRPSSSSSSSSSPSSPATYVPSSSAHHAHLSGGAVAGIVVGALAGLALAVAVLAGCCLRRSPRWQQRLHQRRRRYYAQHAHGADGDGGDGDGTGGNAAMLSPLSPTGGGTRAGKAPPRPPRPGDMAQLGGGYAGLVHAPPPDFRHRTPPVGPPGLALSHDHGLGPYAAGSPYPHVYVPGLPIYNSMATMPPHALASPLQSHPTFASGSFKDGYGWVAADTNHLLGAAPAHASSTPTPTPPLPPPPPRPTPPVELPTTVAVAAVETASAAPSKPKPAAGDTPLAVPPPAALKESPVMGADGAWGAEEATELRI